MASIRYVATDIDRSVEFYRDKLGFSADIAILAISQRLFVMI